MYLIIILLKILIIILSLLIAVAYFTLVERKVLGAIQRRRGPNVFGVYGLLQPLIDGFKLLVKETVIPSNSNKKLFKFSPVLTFSVSLIVWAVIPFYKYSFLSNVNLSLIYVFAVGSLGVYGIIMSGWSSNSKYAFLGSLRSTAQMVSYEVSFTLSLLCIVLISGSLNLQDIILAQKNCWNIFLFFPLFLIVFTSSLAETNRHPFDLPEAESELVSGYNVEYSAMSFALFSLGEYSNMLFMSSINVILFFGGWLPIGFLDFTFLKFFWFGFKLSFFVLLYIFMRAALPRYRYDQLMRLGWKTFLPITLSNVYIVILILFVFNIRPF